MFSLLHETVRLTIKRCSDALHGARFLLQSANIYVTTKGYSDRTGEAIDICMRCRRVICMPEEATFCVHSVQSLRGDRRPDASLCSRRGKSFSAYLFTSHASVLKSNQIKSNVTPVFENTYFTFFSDFKKHDFLRFCLK